MNIKIGDKFKVKVGNGFVDFVCSTRALDHIVLASYKGTVTLDNFELSEQISLGRIQKVEQDIPFVDCYGDSKIKDDDFFLSITDET